MTVSVVLSYLHSSYWLLFTLFVGLNLLAVPVLYYVAEKRTEDAHAAHR